MRVNVSKVTGKHDATSEGTGKGGPGGEIGQVMEWNGRSREEEVEAPEGRRCPS